MIEDLWIKKSDDNFLAEKLVLTKNKFIEKSSQLYQLSLMFIMSIVLGFKSQKRCKTVTEKIVNYAKMYELSQIYPKWDYCQNQE